jgi:hypothetical protein
MRKEVLFTIIAGAILGIVIAFGIWRTNASLSINEEEVEENPSQEQEITPTPTLEHRLTLAKPNNLQVFNSSQTAISGITRPDTWVVLSAEEEDRLFITGNNGEFNQEIDLIGGINQIVIFSFIDNSETAKEDLTLVYSTKFPSNQPSETDATDEAEILKEKVEEKIEKAANVSQAYIGTITDIVESSIQIKSSDDEIKQISINQEEASLVKVNKTTKNIEFSDVAIGDFIIAMGYLKENNGVLEAKRIVVSDPFDFKDKLAIKGTIKEINKENLLIETFNNIEISVDMDSKVDLTIQKGDEVKDIRFNQFNVRDSVIVVGISTSDTSMEARRVHVTEVAPSPSPSPVSSPSPASKSKEPAESDKEE